MYDEELYEECTNEEIYDENADKEITFMLFNYHALDEIIERRKEEIIYNTNKGVNSWLRRKDDAVEQAVYLIENDRYINRILTWKRLIANLKKLINKKLYIFIKYNYFSKLDKNEVCKKMLLDEEEYKLLNKKAKNCIYNLAVRNNLYVLKNV